MPLASTTVSPSMAPARPTSRPRPSRLRRRAGQLLRLATLRPFEWWTLAKMTGMLGSVLVLQRMWPLPRLVAFFDAEPAPEARHLPLRRLKWLSTSVMRLTLRRDFCMKRSLILLHFLRRAGYPTRIFFGVSKADGTLKGHAWVEIGGLPFAEKTDPRKTFRVTYAYPPADEAARAA